MMTDRPANQGGARWSIVAGVDGSAESRHALRWAVAEAGLHLADLQVIHVLDPPLSEVVGLGDATDDGILGRAAALALAEAGEGVLSPLPPAVHVRKRSVRGDPATRLVDIAASADLLVVGSRGRGGVTGFVLGSVSQRCVQHATRPVAVVSRSARLPGRDDVVVGVDGSPGSWSALRWAVAEAAARRARLAVVHASISPVLVGPTGVGTGARGPADLTDWSNHLLHDMVDGTVGRAALRPPDIELVPAEGHAPSVLLDRARGAGLLVLGSRGRGAVAGLLLGSVSQHAVRHAECAVVVVPETGS